MMGERDPQKQLWSYQVNLDKRMRSDHPLRRINQALDLDFVRPEVAKFYGTKGNVSEDPVVIMKMMLLLFLDRINESHELTEVIDQHQTNTQIAAETIVADCKYGTIENYIGCQKRKLRTHMADLLASSPGSGRRDGIYPESMVRYQPQRDPFLCPAGQVMKPRRLHSVRLTWENVTKRGSCLSF